MNKLYGAIIGDISGSTYEFISIKHCLGKEELINFNSIYTDDTILTLAIAKGISDVIKPGWMGIEEEEEKLYNSMMEQVVSFAKLYPYAGYGGTFRDWVVDCSKQPYDSFGNGSAMRASYCGWIANNIYEAERLAEISASITHNHPEGIKGAKVVAGCIFLLKTGCGKAEVYDYVSEYYDVSFELDDIRDSYQFDVSCQGSVPQAIRAFLEGDGFCDVISLAISIGGDSDTIAAIAGSIAEAFYKISDFLYKRVDEKLALNNDFLLNVLDEVNDKLREFGVKKLYINIGLYKGRYFLF